MLPLKSASSTDASQSQLFTIHVAVREGIDIVTVTGEIDHLAHDPLHNVLDARARQSGRVVLDLAGVSFMDSTGIRILVATTQTMAEHPGAWLRLAAPSPAVLGVLTIVGLDTILPIHPTLADALRA